MRPSASAYSAGGWIKPERFARDVGSIARKKANPCSISKRMFQRRATWRHAILRLSGSCALCWPNGSARFVELHSPITDLSGFSIFEKAQYRGARIGDRLL